ncbi:unnamed protein product [Vitrella brassicaformis CCMP3155]|uniref:N-acetyltransferase domain-containing protein n=1 Tax=Vitrella brassicaformis (strain CCMP3155) TaxID=1169540 RepID=A0A0G4EHE6_VITBC|nr:unnamed protein product [Vitrella brassicaformis CCMP3155]|eukprot:CEL95599.1 unnamed protein product [Vitrella brassicaformis CCMP3155]
MRLPAPPRCVEAFVRGGAQTSIWLKAYPLAGGPWWLRVHQGIIVKTEGSTGRPLIRHYDFLPENATQLTTVARLLTGQTVQGRVRRVTLRRMPRDAVLLAEGNVLDVTASGDLDATIWGQDEAAPFSLYQANCLTYAVLLAERLTGREVDQSKIIQSLPWAMVKSRASSLFDGLTSEHVIKMPIDEAAYSFETRPTYKWPDNFLKPRFLKKMLLEGRVKTTYECRLIYKGKSVGSSGWQREGRSSPALDRLISDIDGSCSDGPRQPPQVRMAPFMWMKIDEGHRGQGLGWRLLQEAARDLARQGYNYVVLICDDDGSGRLRQYYERGGFREAASLDDNAMVAPIDTVLNGVNEERMGRAAVVR